MSQSVCSNYAVQISRIFNVQESRFDSFFAILPGLQTALMAAGTLMDGIIQISEPAQRDLSIRHLNILLHALTAMSAAYQPAEIMVKAIQSFLEAVPS